MVKEQESLEKAGAEILTDAACRTNPEPPEHSRQGTFVALLKRLIALTGMVAQRPVDSSPENREIKASLYGCIIAYSSCKEIVLEISFAIFSPF